MAAIDDAVAKLKERLRSVVIDGRTYYIAEGDLLLAEDRLEQYAAGGQANAPPPAPKQRDELVGILRNGRIVRWKPGLELGYAIVRASFSPDNYKLVRGAMQRATAAWEAICGVTFRHQVDLDAAGDGSLFKVLEVDTGGEFIAAAFFPDEPPFRRQVIIDPSFYTTSFDQDGVLRHELGHVLGFRHEHIRPEASPLCPKEDTDGTINLGDFDPKSVMHYFCGGVGSKELAISEKDVIAAQRLYGPPAALVEDIEG